MYNDYQRGNNSPYYKQLTPCNRIMMNKYYVNGNDINQSLNQHVRNTLMDRGISLISKYKNDNEINKGGEEGIEPYENGSSNTLSRLSLNGSDVNVNRAHLGDRYPYTNYTLSQSRSYNENNRYSNDYNHIPNHYNDNQNMPYSVGRSPLPLPQALPMSRPLFQTQSYNLSNQFNKRYLPLHKPNPNTSIRNLNNNFNFLSKSLQHNNSLHPHQQGSSMTTASALGSNSTSQYPEDISRSFNPVENKNLNISYDNYVLDEEKRQRQKELYKRDLLSQMKINEQKKAQAKAKKQQEERDEEARLQRETQDLQNRLELENDKTKQRYANNDFFNQYMTDLKLKRYKANPQQRKADEEEEEKERQRKLKIEEEKKTRLDKLNEFTQKEVESRRKFADAMNQLKEHVNNKNIGLYDNIQSLKNETSTTSKNREQAYRQIEALKKGLIKQRMDEALLKRYVYDVINDDRLKALANNKVKGNEDYYNRQENDKKEMPKPIIDDEDSNEIRDRNSKSLLINSDKEVNMNLFEYNKDNKDNEEEEEEEEKAPMKIIDINKESKSRGIYINDYHCLSKYFKKHKDNKWKMAKKHLYQDNKRYDNDNNDKDLDTYSNAGTIFLNNVDRLNNLKKLDLENDEMNMQIKASKPGFNQFLTKLNSFK